MNGERDLKVFEINLLQLPLFNGTIAAKFTLLNRFVGNGSIFSMGLFGFKYSYGHNKTQYPTFPHFPGIKGINFAFTGLLIDIESAQPGYPGHYFVGIGMTFVTLWNRIE